MTLSLISFQKKKAIWLFIVFICSFIQSIKTYWAPSVVLSMGSLEEKDPGTVLKELTFFGKQAHGCSRQIMSFWVSPRISPGSPTHSQGESFHLSKLQFGITVLITQSGCKVWLRWWMEAFGTGLELEALNKW